MRCRICGKELTGESRKTGICIECAQDTPPSKREREKAKEDFERFSLWLKIKRIPNISDEDKEKLKKYLLEEPNLID